MARVVVDTKVTIQPVVARPVRPHAVEEVDGFLACFEVTERFRLEAEMKMRARDVLDAFPQVLPYHSLLFRGVNEFLVGAGNGADAAFDVAIGRHYFEENIQQTAGVSQSFRSCPIGRVNLLFDARAMKLAVRESVDCEYVTVLAFKPFLEGAQLPRIIKLARGLVTQPETDGVFTFRANSIAHCERITFQGVPGLRPGLAAIGGAAEEDIKIAGGIVHPNDVNVAAGIHRDLREH